jgi:hypothetical protein
LPKRIAIDAPEFYIISYFRQNVSNRDRGFESLLGHAAALCDRVQLLLSVSPTDIEEGYISTACCIMANLSMELGRGLRWDAEAGKVIGDR